MSDFKKLKEFKSRRVKLDQDKEEFLRQRGWDRTSSFPDSCWRWFQEIDGQRFTTASADEALRVDAYLP